jgi:hypothetical protein
VSVSEYLVLFVLVAIMGAGLPGPGDASRIAAGTLAGEGRLSIWIVLETAWLPGCSVRWLDMRLVSARNAGCSTTRTTREVAP